MKKTLVSVAVAFLISSFARGEVEVVDGIQWTYSISNGVARLGGGNSSTTAISGTHGDVVIPSVLGGCSVEVIDEYAFYGSSVDTVTIPRSVKKIGDYAFWGCSAREIRIFSSDIEVSSIVFWCCNTLTKVIFRGNRIKITNQAFWCCDNLLTAEFVGNDLVMNNAFSSCDSLSTVFIDGGMPEVGSSMGVPEICFPRDSVGWPTDIPCQWKSSTLKYWDGFSISTIDGVEWHYKVNGDNASIVYVDCGKDVVVPSRIDGHKVVAIETGAFANCSNLVSVLFPETIERLGDDVFHGCDSLETVLFPDTELSIGSNLFWGCNSLRNISLPRLDAALLDVFGTAASGVTNVVLSERQTEIPNGMFANCTSLMNVENGDVVREIGDAAFSNCCSLTGYEFSDCLSKIGAASFYGSGLVSVSIPDGISNVGKSAFANCHELREVAFHEGITNVGSFAFLDCEKLNRVCVHDLGSWMNVDFENATANPLNAGAALYINGDEVLDLVVPDGIKTIGSCAFVSGRFTSVTIPNSVTNVKTTAFVGCTNIVSVTLGEGLVSETSLVVELACETDWTVETEYMEGQPIYRSNAINHNGSTSVEFQVPSGMEQLKFSWKVTSESNCDWLTWYLDGVLKDRISGVRDWQSVLTPLDGAEHRLKFIYSKDGSVSTSPDCGWLSVASSTAGNVTMARLFPDAHGGIRELILPNGAACSGDEFLAGCTSLVSVTLPSSLAVAAATQSRATLESVVLTDVPEVVEDGLFANCVRLQSFVVPFGTVEIGAEAFAGCTALTSVTIPDSVKRIGTNAFLGCSSLKSLNLPSNLVDFGLGVIPEHLRASMGLVYDDDGFIIYNGWLLDYDDKWATSLEVPKSVIGIGHSALAEMYDLETVRLPSTLMYIGAGAFQDDSYLDHVVIPDSVETIGDAAFCDCSYLQTIAFGSGLKSIGVEAFKGCTQLQRVVLLDGLATVGADAFNGDWRMQSVSLPTSVLSVASSAFSGCSSLTGMTVPTMCGTMAEWFDPIKSQIREATVPAGTTEVVSDMFVGCSGLQKVVLPESVTNIGDYAFFNCSSLKEVTICGAGLVRVGTEAFKGCSSIGELILPESVVSLGDEAIRGCSSLRAFVLPENVSRLGAGVFRECSGLKDVTLSRGLTELPAYTFYGCSQLDSFYVSAFVTNMGAHVCSSATRSIYYLGNAPSCDADVFASASSVVNYVILGTKGWDGRPHSRDIPQSWQGRGILTWTANQFDVTYDAGGGVFIPIETNTYACEQITYTGYKLPPYNPKRNGYWFDGWWTEENGGTEIRTTTRVVLTKPHLLYAHWKPIPEGQLITIHFNATGGTVVPEEQKYAASEPYCELPVPTREHFTFTGWSTETVGGIRQTIYSSAPKADRELFAQWIPNVYTIRFHSNNGNDVTVDQQYVYGTSVTLRSNDFTKNNAAFDGWSLESDGEVVYEDRATMTNVGAVQNGVIHLYAVWKQIVLNYAVRFDSHGGEGVMPNQTFEIGVQQNLSSCQFTRAGFVFGGWALTTDGTVVFNDEETVTDLTTVQNSTVVLYAVWERDPAQEWTIEEYLNCTNITFTLGGDSPHWYGLKTSRDEKSGMMRSGAIGDTQTNWIEAVVSGPGTISFWWKSSGEFWQGKKIVELCDYAEFMIDGVSVAKIGAESSWVTVTRTIEQLGSHTFRWMYHKDESVSDGEDCAWLSEVTWTPSPLPDPIPDLGDTPSATAVAAAVDGAADAKVVANINETNYNDYRAWAMAIGAQTVKDSQNAWLSFALNSDKLIDKAPTNGQMRVEKFEPTSTVGSFSFIVSIDDIAVGDDASTENLKKVFGIEGGTTLDALSSANVDLSFGTPVDGKVKFTAGPNEKNADAKTFFMKVKMIP